MKNDVSVRAAEGPELGRVLDFLDGAYTRWAGPIDRKLAGITAAAHDAGGCPLRYFLAEENGRITGAVGVTASGVVADWAVAGAEDPEGLALRLIDCAQGWAARSGAQTIELVLNVEEALPDAAAWDMGFRPVDPPVGSMRVLDFASLLRAFSIGAEPALRECSPFELHLHLDRGQGPPVPKPDLTIRVTGETTIVGSATPVRPDARASCVAERFAEFVFRARDEKKFFEKDLSVDPARLAPSVHTVLGALRVGRPWHVPLGEHR